MSHPQTSVAQAFGTHDEFVNGEGRRLLDIYRRELDCMISRASPIRFLQIGTRDGHVLQLWREVLPPGSCVSGIDIDPSVAALGSPLGGESFDVVVDRSSHGAADTLAALDAFLPRVRPGGLYIVEDGARDLEASADDGSVRRESAIEALKRLAGGAHAGDPAREDAPRLASICAAGAGIARIRFQDSMVVIEKAASVDRAEPRLGSGPETRLARVHDVPLDAQQPLRGDRVTGGTTDGAPPHATARHRKEAGAMIAAEEALRRSLDNAVLRRAEAEEALRQAQRDMAHAEREATERLKAAEAARDAMLRSTSWRVTRPLRSIVQRARPIALRVRLLASAARPGGVEARAILSGSLRRRMGLAPAPEAKGIETPASATSVSSYEDWLRRFDTLSSETRRAIVAHAASEEMRPLTVVAVFSAGQERHVGAFVRALRDQIFTRWTCLLCVDPACGSAAVADARAAANGEGRIMVIEAPAPAEIPAVAADAAVVMCDGRVQLREHGLYLFAAALAEQPGLALAYADEDTLDASGGYGEPFFKPIFSPELLRGMPYLGPCVLLGPGSFEGDSLPAEILRDGVDAVARRKALSAGQGAVARIPRVAYHVRQDAKPVPAPPHAAVATAPAADAPSVTIIVPTRDKVELLRPCLESVAARTDYPADRLEIVVVDNGSTEAATLNYLRAEAKAGRIRLMRDRRPFNYAQLNNAAARTAKGDILVFLNNDTVVNDPNWLRELVRFAAQPDTGAVGCKLVYPDHTVQHGGVVLGINGVAAHAHVGVEENDPGYHGLASTTHEISAVTGACLAMRRTVFEEIGGFDETLAVAFNDVLLCLDALSHGYRNLYVGAPLLEHHESKSRGTDDTPRKRALFRREALYTRQRHSRLMRDDPYYSPNLSFDTVHGLAVPPRAPRPWRSHALRAGAPIRVLMLSSTHALGHGVAVVLERLAARLAHDGFEVIMAGPAGPRDVDYPGCERVVLHDAREAACLADAREVDVVVAHTPPFFSTVRWLGPSTPFIAYDYGEPPPELFDDALRRIEQNDEKAFVLTMADRIYAISRAIRDESPVRMTGVIPLANSHLACWNEDLVPRRAAVRSELGWDGRFVVLNVCRFHEAERRYKGVDVYVEVAERFAERFPELRERVVFALCGKAAPTDVENMEALGLSVFSNVSDERLIDLYAAADGYMNFSKWEGYNLGIGQALAMGLPVIASDVPAHREFPIPVEGDVERLVEWLAARVTDPAPVRAPVVFSWDKPTAMFADVIRDVCSATASAVDRAAQAS